MSEDGKLNASRDEQFLLRFLRYHKLNPALALKTLKIYHKSHTKEKDIYTNLVPSKLDPVFAKNLVGVLPDKDPFGRIILVLRAGSWNSSELTFVDMMRGIMLCFEYIMTKESSQVQGIIMLCDMDGWGNGNLTSVPVTRLKMLAGIWFNPPVAQPLV
ncbi:phosphatidylinositol transfer protein SEC14, putative [Ixodes scapularis]|uniref:Phosphatidylinositol transfer protein SEC14, putative n=1 Tax=Ixodes scapularis TaxID=6945 RepID=B7PUK4_IXOSC|nr:phosphatidylinositol transfer protein SEC14, putative [Ixodes scapularis]|eukprot:XP_002406223.1 phosphatidylinositol transfer protein SEC14, putative [Ixodes scapularis]